jgi:hypothetical protein
MKELKFICVQPDDKYYIWQTHLWIESLKELGYSDKAIVIIFTPYFRESSKEWQKIIYLYPEVKFLFYKDENNELNKSLEIYAPVIRPYCLSRYFTDYSEEIKNAYFYCDCDIVFTKNFNIENFVQDNINYLSNTNSYINASYFASKEKDVLSIKLESYKNIDVLNQLCSLVGISKERAILNNDHSGGAQYLLKNLDGEFWKKVMKDCILIRQYLLEVNRQFFENENKGFQSWCADMWALLYNIWYREVETKVISELDFAWAPDNISKLDNVGIFHNAGIINDIMFDCPVFYKGKYHTGINPFKDMIHLNNILTNEKSRKYCTYFYTFQLIKLLNKYNLNY